MAENYSFRIRSTTRRAFSQSEELTFVFTFLLKYEGNLCFLTPLHKNNPV